MAESSQSQFQAPAGEQIEVDQGNNDNDSAFGDDA
jgi:hypothetical protein